MQRKKDEDRLFISNVPLTELQIDEILAGMTGEYILEGPLRFPASLEATHIRFECLTETIDCVSFSEMKSLSEFSEYAGRINISAHGRSTGCHLNSLIIDKKRESIYVSLSGDSVAVDSKLDFLEGYPQLRNVRQYISDEYNRISSISNERERGIEFQDLILGMQQYEGWEAKNMNRRDEHGKRQSIEELDTTAITPSLQYVITEVRWKRNRFSGNDADALNGKLQRRHSATFGLAISMSGFTESAFTRRKEWLSHRVIVFMDKQDIEKILIGDVTMGKLFNQKLRNLLDRFKE